jgi:CSLREA domain-containing protein
MAQWDSVSRRRGRSRSRAIWLSVGSLLIGSILAIGPAHAATFVVDSTGDGTDQTPGNGVCSTGPPTPVCTLRAAIQEANALAGADTINFNIAPAGAKTIVLGAALPAITTIVILDGTTQPGYGGTPIIELNATSGGANAVSLNGAGSSASTIRGLAINRSPGRAIRLFGSSNNVIAGNFLGTNVAGTGALGNNTGVYIGGSATATNNNRIGGTAAADRNVISGNTADGIQVNGGSGGAANNVIEGNYIGVDVNGILDLGNANQGVAVFSASFTNTNNVIGGTAIGAGNVISGNNNMGILIADSGTTGTLVQGNRIGTNAAGTAGVGNSVAGIHFDNPTSNNTVGGTVANAGNLIAYNGQAGVQLTITVGTGNAILGNAIHSNTDLGIDLRDDGLTANDAGDGDTGANNLQNFPVLSAAMTNGAGSLNFAGSLNSAATTVYRIEFFASSAADPSGFGEGQRYLGFTNVTTNASGNAVIGVTLATVLTAGEFVTATATDPSNNTSEFSATLVAVGSLVVTTTADTTDGDTTSVSALIANPGLDGRISLPEAILATNATAGTDTIRFGIPLTDANHLYYGDDAVAFSLTNVQVTALADSAIADFDPDYPPALARSWYRIQPSSALPAFTDAVILDGSTQPGFLVGGPVIELDGAGAGASSGLQVNGGNSTIRGIVVHSFQVEGIVLAAGDSNTVAGNYSGTDVSGKLDRGNGDDGIDVGAGSANNVIGGTTIADRNLLSGNTGTGIAHGGALAIGNVVLGNYIGTDVTGTAPLGNTGPGVVFNAGSGNNTIGGSAAGSGNLIAFNNRDGVRLAVTAGSGVSILGNSIFGNGENGIDLNNDAVTPNDPGDADAGPNSLLNFPENTAALESGGTLTVYFKLDLAAGWYRIEFFKNPSGADPSGNGEGQTFASSVNINHLGGGSQNFNHSFAGVVGDVITTTTTFCTDGAACAAFSDTSEFAAAVTAVPTAVELMSFTALGREQAVDLNWQTGSELNNLGFHLYRSLSPSGPFERITDGVIPGLGSSPTGRNYAYRDSGLANGVTYFYKLEDIETTGKSAFHGPVSATPEEEEGAASEDLRMTYGDPSEVSLRIVERSPDGVLVELTTGGFFATPLPDGTVRLEVRGFEELGAPGSPALPVKSTWLDAVAGRKVRIASVRAFEVSSFAGFQPEGAGSPELVASREGTVWVARRKGPRSFRDSGLFPSSAARVVETGFQGDVKKVLLELAPLRWNGASGRLLWARRLRVGLAFAGVEPSETAFGGSRGRRHRLERSHAGGEVLARLTTSEPGLYRVSLADVLGFRKRSVAPSELRLRHRGELVPFHAEPPALYFLGARDAVYEWELGSGGQTMPIQNAAPSGPPVSAYLFRREWEQNRYYQAGLLEAPSLWLWDVLVSPGSKSYPFTVRSLLDREAKLEVHLQGASDFEAAEDHHVRISVNGMEVGGARWDGKLAKTVEALLAPGVLREGDNELSIENVGDTAAAYSMVFLDRFALTYARPVVADEAILEGRFRESGTVTIASERRVVQTSPEMTWLRGTDGGSFRVEAGRSYLAVTPDAILEGKLRRASASGLRSTGNRADYLLIGPGELLATAAPLLARRRSQGLISRAVAIEEIYDEFGHGEPGPEGVKAFLEYAYHHWTRPSVRYVVLLGDATYDTKDYLQTGVMDRVPAPMRKTSYLWTASDPSYSAVNGDDVLPDLALGRLPAASVAEARLLVTKVLAYEESGLTLSGPAVLVADDPDAAGDFEKDSEGIASLLTGREVRRIYLGERGADATRSAIRESFDSGASLLSYVGHGGIALWASENVLQSRDVDSLSPQAQQPIVMTMNCLNGYFHFPYFDALGEALLKAEGKGAIAAFSPSGLSLDAPAHVYQKGLVGELVSGRHRRLGDAVLAAQRTYAESGAFPELLTIYHLFGDPALQIR